MARRGVEAPFQLLVSVITMVLVIAIAYQVLMHGVQQRCSEQWQRSLNGLALALSEVANSGQFTSKAVKLELACGGADSVKIYLQQRQGAYCLRACGEAMDQCYILTLVAQKTQGGRTVNVGVVNQCIKGFSNAAYWMLSSSKGSCPPMSTSGITLEPFFTGSTGSDHKDPGVYGEGVYGEISPVPPTVVLYIYRGGPQKINVCRVKYV